MHHPVSEIGENAPFGMTYAMGSQQFGMFCHECKKSHDFTDADLTPAKAPERIAGFRPLF